MTGTPNITMLASSHKQEEGSSLIPKMELTITQQQHLFNISSKCGDRMKNWVPIVPWFLPPLLTYKESQASKHTNNGKTPQVYFFSKKHGKKGGKVHQENSIEHKQMRRRRKKKQKRKKLRERGDERYSLSSVQKTKNPITRMRRGNQAWGVKVMLTLIMLSSIILLFSISGEKFVDDFFLCFDQAKQ